MLNLSKFAIKGKFDFKNEIFKYYQNELKNISNQDLKIAVDQEPYLLFYILNISKYNVFLQ